MRFAHRLRASAVVAVLVLTASMPAFAREPTPQQHLVEKATTVVENFAADPQLVWFRRNLADSYGVLVIPSLVKGGFILGGSGGSGVMLGRSKAEGTWSYPAFYTMGSVTFGLQIGGEVSEIVLLIMTERGRDAMLSDELKLGGDVSIAVGPVGAGAKAQTVDVLAFSKTKGLYGGLNIEGAVIATREDWNRAYYGEGVDARAIIVARTASNPDADMLREAMRAIAEQD